MVKIAITGGNGFIAQHLINRFQTQQLSAVESILTIDRKPKCHNYLDYPETIPMTHFQTDLTNTKLLETVLADCDVVFHLARKRLNLLFETELQEDLHESYIHDNITATESVISAMISSNVQHLVFLGDAYANLEVEDNFGPSEDNFPGIGKSFIMGQAGESRIRAELIARNAVGKPLKNGKDLRATFPRPVFVYGEGDVKFFQALEKVAKSNGNSVPIISGPSSGMFQYIYAGNLAGMLESSMTTLMNEPERCNGDYFYCMEDPKATRISEFLSPIASALDISFGPENNFFVSYWSTVLSQLKQRIFGSDPKKAGSEFSSTAFRFLFGYAYGFANRKQQLIIDYRAEIDQSDALAKTAKWIKKEWSRCGKDASFSREMG